MSSVVETREAAQPSSYAQRWQFSLDHGGTVVPKATATQLPDVLKTVRFNRNADNELEAFVPALAYGRVGMLPNTVMTEWSVDNVANWDMSYIPNDGKQDIRAARRWWRWDPLTFRCVKVLTQLANARLTIECDHKDFKGIVEMWLKKAVPHSFRREWFLEYFRSSMVPVLKTLIPYKPRDYKSGKIPQTNEGRVEAPMERSTGEEEPDYDRATAEATQKVIEKQGERLSGFSKSMKDYRQALEMHKQGLCSEARLHKLQAVAAQLQYQWLAGNIAGSYTILDPLDIYMDGPPEMAWLRQPYLMVGGAFVSAIENPKPEQAEMIAKLPLDIVRQIREGATKVWLSPNICTVTFGEKQPYERYPTPIVCHAEEALKLKMMLYQMDKSVAKSVRDKILKVTIGNDQYPAFDEAQIQAVANIFNNPSRNLTIFWNHTLECEWVEPKDTSLADEKKYTHVNSEIRTAFGISAMITGTGDKNSAVGDGILNLKGLEEEVGDAQDIFLEWLAAEIELLKQALGVGFEVRVTFDKMNLRDPEKFMAILLQLYQGGVIDPETTVSTMGFHFPTIVNRMKDAIKLRKSGLFMPIPSSNNLGPDGMILPQKNGAASPKGGGIRGTGRPALQPKTANQQKRGTSQPKKAKARLIPGADGLRAYLVLDRDLTAEEKATAAERFSIPTEWVLSEAEYKASTGKTLNWLPPLPELTTGELYGVITNAQKALAEINGKVEAAIEKYKAENAGGKRGAYVTAKMREDLEAQARAEVLAPFRPKVAEEEWKQRLIVAEEDIRELGLTDRNAREAHTAQLLAAKYQKLAIARRGQDSEKSRPLVRPSDTSPTVNHGRATGR